MCLFVFVGGCNLFYVSGVLFVVLNQNIFLFFVVEKRRSVVKHGILYLLYPPAWIPLPGFRLRIGPTSPHLARWSRLYDPEIR